MKNKIYYIYPFTPGPQDSIELRYSLRSMIKYVKDDYIIVITGDRKPNWLDINFRNIEFLNSPKISKEKDKNIYDSILKAIEKFNIEKFIKLSDDNVFLQDFKCSYVISPYWISEMRNTIKDKSILTHWQNKLWDTIEFSKSLKLTCFNYESHGPQLFYSDKLIECNKVFNISSGEHLLATAYYNFFHKEIINNKKDIKDIKWGSWGKNPDPIEPTDVHIFGNQDPIGLKFTLPVIKNLFQKKSKFEKYDNDF